MAKTRNSVEPEESVLRDVREVAAVEHYRYSVDRPKPRKPPVNYSYVGFIQLACLLCVTTSLRKSARSSGGASTVSATLI